MTNREKFEQYLQRQLNILKGLSDEDFAICANLSCHEELWAFAAGMGEKWKCVDFGYPMPLGQHERIVAWLRKEADHD